ncbi:hypothetical protein [Nostoc sp.]|uniref:hypothetical protein n=1 Tax=Nostoc sp. TaxID=1180 RepID=UPI002FF4CF85
MGGWGRSLTPHTPHTPLPLKPTLCVRNPGVLLSNAGITVKLPWRLTLPIFGQPISAALP